jgi:hypothetical protein
MMEHKTSCTGALGVASGSCGCGALDGLAGLSERKKVPAHVEQALDSDNQLASESILTL